MYIFGLFSCALFVGVSGIIDVPDLQWPDEYTFEAEIKSLTSGWVDTIKYWRSKSASRVDYNNGAVKIVNTLPRKHKRTTYGVKYEVHPETTEEKLNALVCKRTNGTEDSRIHLDDVLPVEYSFDHCGSEVIEDTAEKFCSTELSDRDETRQTVWATRNLTNNSWIPVRFEDIVYDTWLGYKSKHEIVEFLSFDTEFDSSKIFNFEKKYDCIDAPPEYEEYRKPRRDTINPKNEKHVDKVFNSFKEKHNKVYADEKEHSFRKNLFQKRMKLVLENNNKETGYKMTINKFADRTPKEMKKYMGLIRSGVKETDTHPFPYTEKKVKKIAQGLPERVDLRDMGLVTPARDQRDCGSCWTFGTTTAVEGALARQNGGRLLRLSNQALLDCAWGYGCMGCKGGFDTGAYRWMMKHGLPTEEEYGSYANWEGYCLINNMTEVYPIRGFTNVTPLDVTALKVAIVNHGPLSVSMNVPETLFLYSSGVYYDPDCDTRALTHEVAVVGYGSRDGEEYWIVKNSWGQSWGIDGYLYISTRDESCGIVVEPTYPVL